MTIRDGDFESVVREHESMLYRIAFNFFLNASVSEDVVQEVFLKCFENLKNIESPAHLKAWLRRAASHRCIDLLRSGKAHPEVQLEELPDVQGTFSQSDPFLSECLRRLVASLPEKQRMIVVLRYGEDMDLVEVAELLDMPAATVRSYLKRALAMLREKAPRALGEQVYGRIGK